VTKAQRHKDRRKKKKEKSEKVKGIDDGLATIDDIMNSRK